MSRSGLLSKISGRVVPRIFSQAKVIKEPLVLPPGVPIEEERKTDYDARHFYPVTIGEVIQKKYEVVFKVGYGSRSTVWLARNIQRSSWLSSQYAILKICVNSHNDTALDEVDLLRHIASVDPSHPGFRYIRQLQEYFPVCGPHGSHMCLVFEPLREPLWKLQERLTVGHCSLQLLRCFMKFFLLALSYLHSECHVIHTDIKPENILVGFEPKFSLDDLVEDERQSPSPLKYLPDRTVYTSRKDFGWPLSTLGRPKISDFDCAVRADKCAGPLTHEIQPNDYRAPEVTMGAPWSYSADIWNLGAMMWDLLEGTSLCDGLDEQREFTLERQLAQLVGLLGPPPKALLDRAEFAGLYFFDNGDFKPRCAAKALPLRSLDDSVTTITGEEKQEFLRFARRMLQWLPEDRATAQELLLDPLIVNLP